MEGHGVLQPVVTAKVSDHKETDLIEDTELLDTPKLLESGVTNLDALLPFLKRVENTYRESKEKAYFTTLNVKDLPLTKLVAPSVTDETSLRRALSQIKENKDNSLDHGAVKAVDALFSGSAMYTTINLADSILTRLIKRGLKAAVNYLSAPVQASVTAVSSVVEDCSGYKDADQKEIILKAVGAASGATKMQHIIQILDMCIEAKDGNGKYNFQEANKKIEEIQEKHVPKKAAFTISSITSIGLMRRAFFGEDSQFEQAFYSFCQAAIILVNNIENTKKISQAPVLLNLIARSPSAESLRENNSEHKIEVINSDNAEIAKLNREHMEALSKSESEKTALKEERDKAIARAAEEFKRGQESKEAEIKQANDRAVGYEDELNKLRPAFNEMDAQLKAAQGTERKRHNEVGAITSEKNRVEEDLRRVKTDTAKLSTQWQEVSRNQTDFTHHTSEMKSAGHISGDFLLLTAGSAAAICYFGMVGTAWVWCVPIAFLFGSAYCAYNYFNERKEVKRLGNLVTTEKKDLLTPVIDWLSTKLEQKGADNKHHERSESKHEESVHEKKESTHEEPVTEKSVSNRLSTLIEKVHGSPSITEHRKHKIFDQLLEALTMSRESDESINQVKARLYRVILNLRGGSSSLGFFGKAEHSAFNQELNDLEIAVAPPANPAVRAVIPTQ